MIDWNKGFTAKYYMAVVDPTTWRDLQKISITGGRVNYVDENLRNSANINCENYTAQVEQYLRIWLKATQRSDAALVPLFTGLVPPPARDIDGNRVSHELEGYSVLAPAEDVLLPRGWYAVRGLSGGEQIKALLRTVIRAPIELEPSSPPLADYIIAEDGENHLSMALKILQAIGWRIFIDGYGHVKICSLSTKPVIRFDSLNNCCLKPQIKASDDWYKCPNVFRAVVDDVYAEARDDDPNSMLSTVRRNREVWDEELDCVLNQNESLPEYAQRMLKEKQQHAVALQYMRKFYPEIFPSNVIDLHFPKQKISGNYYITSQSFELGEEPLLSEEVIQIA